MARSMRPRSISSFTSIDVVRTVRIVTPGAAPSSARIKRGRKYVSPTSFTPITNARSLRAGSKRARAFNVLCSAPSASAMGWASDSA
ncbi:hypothetical protein G6F22_020336 [Rhizopus arrhizus]|nr:hypothetical protein G6F22_020336 [Rhizopus arrhizus]KAG1254571.1 hypothetical protein G6F66_015009 [Rhizopus arrhizus]